MDHIKHIFDTNTFAILRVCKVVVPIMAQRRSGTIVNIGSIVGEMWVLGRLPPSFTEPLPPSPSLVQPRGMPYTAHRKLLLIASARLYLWNLNHSTYLCFMLRQPLSNQIYPPMPSIVSHLLPIPSTPTSFHSWLKEYILARVLIPCRPRILLGKSCLMRSGRILHGICRLVGVLGCLRGLNGCRGGLFSLICGGCIHPRFAIFIALFSLLNSWCANPWTGRD